MITGNTAEAANSIQSRDVRSAGPILFLLNSLGMGGSERKTVNVVTALRNRGWDVHLAYLNPPETLLGSLGADVPNVCLQRTGKLSYKAIMALRRYVQRNGIRRLVCINLYPLLYAQLATGWFWHQSGPVVISMINTTEVVGAKDKVFMLGYGSLMKRSKAIVFGCRSQLDMWCKRYALDKSRCQVIYNGVDVEYFAPLAMNSSSDGADASKHLSEKHFVVGTVGQLRPEKNQVELLLAMANLKDVLPHAKLVIVGDGPERKRLEMAAREQCIDDRVVFLGEVRDVRPAIRGMDIFVLPSASETFSNAALEALSMAKVVVLSDIGGSREMIDDGYNGFLYESGSVSALCTIIRRLADDPERRACIAAHARDTAFRRLSFYQMIEAYERLINHDI